VLWAPGERDATPPRLSPVRLRCEVRRAESPPVRNGCRRCRVHRARRAVLVTASRAMARQPWPLQP